MFPNTNSVEVDVHHELSTLKSGVYVNFLMKWDYDILMHCLQYKHLWMIHFGNFVINRWFYVGLLINGQCLLSHSQKYF